MTQQFNIFGRVVLIEKDANGWHAFYPGSDGKKRPADFVVPPDVENGELEQYLGDLFHEYSRPGHIDVVRL